MAKKKAKKIIKKKLVRKKPTQAKSRKKKVLRQADLKGQRIFVKEIINEEPEISSSYVETPAITSEPEEFFNPEASGSDFGTFDFEQIEEEISQPELVVEEDQEIEKDGMTARQKNIIMYTSIVAIMAVIVVFWFLAARISLSQNLTGKMNVNKTNDQFGFDQQIEQIKSDFGNLKNYLGQQGQALINLPNQLRLPIITAILKKDVANKIKSRLENLNLDGNLNTNQAK